MKTSACPPPARNENTRPPHTGATPGQTPANDSAADAFSLLLSGLGEVVVPSGAEGTDQATAQTPTPGESKKTEANGTAADPRAPFLALFQPAAPASEGQPTASPAVAADAQGKGTQLAATVPNPANNSLADRSTPARPASKALSTPSATALLQTQHLDAQLPTPTLALAQTAAAAVAEAPAMRAWHLGRSAPVASTGAELGGTAPALAGPSMAAFSSPSVLALGGQAPGGDSPPPGGGAGAAAWLDTSGTSTTHEAASASGAENFAANLSEALGEAYETLGSQVSLWAAHQTKRASMQVDLGSHNVLQVEVTLEQDKAQLTFHSDDAHVREHIKNQAQEVLGELLAREGIALDSVSVGARQGGQSGDGRAPERPTLRMGLPGTNNGTSNDPTQALPPRLPAQGRLGLDVYA